MKAPVSSGEDLIRKHLGMDSDYKNWPACYQALADELGELALIGTMWKADSSLAKWFPMTAEALEEIRQVATGERQVCNDDTDGLDWIARRIAAINPPTDATANEGNDRDSMQFRIARNRCKEFGFELVRDQCGFWIKGGGGHKRYVKHSEDLHGWIVYLSEHGF